MLNSMDMIMPTPLRICCLEEVIAKAVLAEVGLIQHLPPSQLDAEHESAHFSVESKWMLRYHLLGAVNLENHPFTP